MVNESGIIPWKNVCQSCFLVCFLLRSPVMRTAMFFNKRPRRQKTALLLMLMPDRKCSVKGWRYSFRSMSWELNWQAPEMPKKERICVKNWSLWSCKRNPYADGGVFSPVSSITFLPFRYLRARRMRLAWYRGLKPNGAETYAKKLTIWF